MPSRRIGATDEPSVAIIVELHDRPIETSCNNHGSSVREAQSRQASGQGAAQVLLPHHSCQGPLKNPDLACQNLDLSRQNPDLPCLYA